MRFIYLLSITALIGPAIAGERELASDGSDVRLTIDDSYRCSPEAAISIVTASADYFDRGADTVQRLSSVAGAVLGFECPETTKITFTGYTDSIAVFSAEAQKSTNWALQTNPAPLEALALLFGLYEPEFFHLGTANDQFQRYENITGIKNTDQYDAYNRQAKRLAQVIDGNVEAFRAYVRNPQRAFESFEQALSHYDDVLQTIERYSPEKYSAYRTAYEAETKTLKENYWTSRIASITEREDKTASNIILEAASLVNASNSPAFVAFVDEKIAAWLREQSTWIETELQDAPLYEVAIASDFMAGFPESAKASALSKTRNEIERLEPNLLDAISSRITALTSLAQATIQETGNSYEDVDTILETGFALAEELEEAGYTDEGQSLLAVTIERINSLLSSGLPAYKKEIADLRLTAETTAALQEQALIFEELSAEFEGFAAYQQTAQDKLDGNKEAICEGVLKEARVNSLDYKKRIFVGDQQITLTELTCDLLENGHVVSEFVWAKRPGIFNFGIDEAGGVQNRFQFKGDNIFLGQNLRIQKRLGENNTPMSAEEWESYIAELLLPPPSGQPNAQGIRDCDTLAADPADPKKLGAGVDFETADLEPKAFDRALEACIAAVENDPEDPRQQFQLGRMLWYAGDQEAASEYLNLAAESGYAPAIYYKAEIMLGTSDDPDAFIDALEMFEASGKAGYAPGAAMVKELNPDGIEFFKEIPPPTEREMMAAIPKKGANTSLFGVSSSIQLVGVDIKECFQMSATDFSCEYKKIWKCGMSGWGNDPIIRFMSAAMQADCRTNYETFSTFRKLGNGTWREIPSN